MHGIRIFLSTAFTLLLVFAYAQEDYSKIFASDYDKAVKFLSDEKLWMDDLILSYGLDPREVKAIVFPELIRYNSIQDAIETFALESLYVQYGKEYANFSIGSFQIKPSFAEHLEIDYLKKFGSQKVKIWTVNPQDTLQNQANRSARLNRLKDKKHMLKYVCLFFKLMQSKYTTWNSIEGKIRYLAAAYNSDYRKSREEINSFAYKKFFQTGLIPSKKYCYADIAWYYFKQNNYSPNIFLSMLGSKLRAFL